MALAPTSEVGEWPTFVPITGATITLKERRTDPVVTVPAFRIARYPTTCTQYAKFVAETGHRAPKWWGGQTPPAGKEDHPVVGVNVADAQAYCKWLSLKRGTVVRLPTEAEWELAAAGPTGRTYPWGEEEPSPKRAQYMALDTAPVGTHPAGATPEGVMDMAGNAWEWCSDAWVR